MRGTKILATVGPSSDTTEILRRLIAVGANGFRINFSHGTPEEHRATLRRIHQIVDHRADPIAIVADLQGPKIRLGPMEKPSVLLAEGAEITLDVNPAPGDGHRMPVTLPNLEESVRPGDPLLIGDGSISLEVTRLDPGSVRTRVVHGGVLTAHAGLFLPRAKLRAKVLGPKDLDDLALAIAEGVDYVAVSFVREAADLRQVRAAVRRMGRGSTDVALIAKIERAEALEQIDGILDASDAIMVARGDLGIEVPLERLALEQKELVRRANAAAKPVIVATQMLLSMVTAPRPTRAEATDVANAVLDGADAVMLSEESAVGAYPAEAVAWLDRIARATEPTLDPDRFDRRAEPLRAGEAFVASSAVRLARQTRSIAIASPTHSGRTARLVARHRPPVPIWAFTSDEPIRRRLALVWGIQPISSPPHEPLLGMRARTVRTARSFGFRSGTAVLTAGFPLEGRPTNLVTLVELRRGRDGSARPRGARPAARRKGAAAGARP